MKQSVTLPVKVPEPILHLHFVSRSDCWLHRPGELLTRLATRLCCRSIRLESCNHPTFRIRTIDRNRLVKHRVDGRDVDYGQRQLVGVSSAPVSGPAPEDESETARRVRIFLENRHTLTLHAQVWHKNAVITGRAFVATDDRLARNVHLDT
jgi:hypothetical protein